MAEIYHTLLPTSADTDSISMPKTGASWGERAKSKHSVPTTCKRYTTYIFTGSSKFEEKLKKIRSTVKDYISSFSNLYK